MTIRTYDLWLLVRDSIQADEEVAQGLFCAALQTLYEAHWISYPYTGIALLPLRMASEMESRLGFDPCLGDIVPVCYTNEPLSFHGLVPVPPDQRCGTYSPAPNSLEEKLFAAIRESFARHHRDPFLRVPTGETRDHQQMARWRARVTRNAALTCDQR